MLKPIRTLWTRKFKTGYTLKREVYCHDGQYIEITTAYSNKDGGYIGKSRDAHYLAKHGIKPETYNNKQHCVIGFSEKDQKWYGWSHRAITGFGIGDKVFEERYGNDKTPFIKHGKITIKVLAQAKIAAIRFAEYIG